MDKIQFRYDKYLYNLEGYKITKEKQNYSYNIFLNLLMDIVNYSKDDNRYIIIKQFCIEAINEAIDRKNIHGEKYKLNLDNWIIYNFMDKDKYLKVIRRKIHNYNIEIYNINYLFLLNIKYLIPDITKHILIPYLKNKNGLYILIDTQKYIENPFKS